MENTNEAKFCEVLLKKMKKERVAKKVKADSAVFLAAAIEFVLAELLDIAGELAVDMENVKIRPWHIRKAIDNDLEFAQLLKNTSLISTYFSPQKESQEINLNGNGKNEEIPIFFF